MPVVRVDIKPELLQWACKRADVGIDGLLRKFPKFHDWENGIVRPTLKQLEKFANFTHTPVGYFFLSTPPDESVPIADLRTIGNFPVTNPSPNLLDTIYLCLQQQDWYRNYALMNGEKPIPFVSSETVQRNPLTVAASIRTMLKFDLVRRRELASWTDALRKFIQAADELGILVMVNGVVGGNTSRKLDAQEFRGFVLADDIAPLVFINGADTKAAQIFTLAHELAHLALGESGLPDVGFFSTTSDQTENWCNQVAAEILVPLATLQEEYVIVKNQELQHILKLLASRFKVSSLVILYRLYDAGYLSKMQFRETFENETMGLIPAKSDTGGDFYANLFARNSRRFTHAIVASTVEGHSSFTEAFQFLGFKKMSTFRALSKKLGIRF